MQVEVVESLGSLRATRDQWTELLDHSPQATPFQRPEWLLPWADLFLEGELRAIFVRDRGRLVALAPLYVWHTADGTRELRFLGSGNTDYQDAVVDARVHDPALAAVADAIAGVSAWDVARFEQMRPGAAFLRLPLPPGCEEAQVAPQERCPVIHLPRDPDALYARLSPGFVKRVRQAQRRATAAGMRTVTATPGEVGTYVEALIDLHARRWKQRDAPGVLASERARTFLRRVALEFSTAGLLVLRVLESGSGVVAAMCGFRDRRRIQYYLGGFDPAYKQLSPGMVLIAHCIEQAIAHGVEEFDFLRGAEAYKYDWGSQDRLNRDRIFVRS